jgi:hypothetical protein
MYTGNESGFVLLKCCVIGFVLLKCCVIGFVLLKCCVIFPGHHNRFLLMMSISLHLFDVDVRNSHISLFLPFH